MNKLNILLMLMMFALISCYSEPEQVAEPGVFKAPILKMNSSAKGGHGGSTANKALEVSIDLPLITWDSFEYRKINLKPGWSQGGGKENFCVVNETDGTPVTAGSPILFLEDAYT